MALQCQVGDIWSWFGPGSFVTPGDQEPCEHWEELTAPGPPSAVTWLWQGVQHLPILGSSVQGCPWGASSSPPGYQNWCNESSFLIPPTCSTKNGEKEKKKPYFVLLAIDYKEPLKHFKENIQKQGWKMSDLSIESWVQYVTAGNPLPLCKSWSPKCMEIFDVFS